MSLPRGVVERLVEAGSYAWRGYGRRAKARRCACGAGVVSGLDSHVMAFETDADPVPLSEVGVLAARLDGRRVVALSVGLGRPELFACSSTVPPRGSVLLPAHRCGSRVPGAWRAPSVASGGTVRCMDLDEPPF